MQHLTRELRAAEIHAEEVPPRQSHVDDPADAEEQRSSSTISYSQQRDALRRTTTGDRVSQLDPIELNRIHTYRLQHAATIGSSQDATPREKWLPLGAGKPHPPPLPDAEEYVVEFTDQHDSLHPHNWPLRTK
jgi:hypothetical protein